MRWSEIETVNFVKIYLSHEYLWNPYDPGYKCRNKRQIAYRNIISKFQSSTGILMDEVDLRIKIKNLRSTYAQEVSKIRQRSGPDFVYTPSIKWFTDWHRCFNNIKKGISSSSDQHEIDETDQNQWSLQSDLDEQNDNAQAVVSQSDDFILALKTEEISPERQQDSQKIKKRKHKHRHSSSNHNIDSTITVKEDEFDIYGKYIASQLRSMELQRALKVQLEIHSIVSEARMSSLSGN